MTQNIWGKWLRMVLAGGLMNALIPAKDARAAHIKIPAGTPVLLSLLQKASSETGNPGDIVRLAVKDDVLIDGKIVIPHGSKAIGDLGMVVKANFVGVPGHIALEVQSITTPEGIDIPVGGRLDSEGESRFVLSLVCGLFCLFPLLIRGSNTFLSEGETIQATVLTTTAVDVP